MIFYESSWNPNAVGDEGCSYGLVRINTCVWEVTPEQALDPNFALRWAAEKASMGKWHYWTVCNCYSLVSTQTNIPRMVEIIPNTPTPVEGGIAIFDYNGIKHIAFIPKVYEDGSFTTFEANKTGCVVENRRIYPSEDKDLIGYWTNG